MRILGIDPGLRHTGFCLTEGENRVVARGVLVPPGRGRIQPHQVLSAILPAVEKLIKQHQPTLAVVEQVTWYGKGRRITLPLAHVAGGLVGFLLANKISVYLLLANQKTILCRKRGWSEHEKDAYVLATEVRRYLAAENAGDVSTLRRRSAVGQRKIIVPRNTHG